MATVTQVLDEVKTQRLLDRFFAKVDKTNDCWIWTAGTFKRGYGQFSILDAPYLAHRVSWWIHHGPIPDGMQVDHKCWNRRCVNPNHLQVVSPSENQQNRKGAQRGATSSFRGVLFYERTGRWMAYAYHHGRQNYLGMYATEEEAARAAREERRKHMPNSRMDRIGA